MSDIITHRPGMMHTIRPVMPVSLNPELLCTKCLGVGHHKYDQFVSGVQQPDKTELYECLACAGTGIAPIPLCEASDGNV